MDHGAMDLLGPAVCGRRLMRELKRLREVSGIPPHQAAARLGFSRSKLYRIENGRTRVDADDLEDLLDLYRVGSPARERLVQLGREARRRGWWERYRDVFPGWYIGLEYEASSIRYCASGVPGLFQTEDYARAVIAATGPWLDRAEVERRVAARLTRQRAIFDRDGAVQIHVVLDECALRRQVGGAAVLRAQLAALGSACTRHEVTVQVLTLAAGAAAGIDSNFAILDFPDEEDPPVIYVECPLGDLYLESKEDQGRCDLIWSRRVSRALNPADSAGMISEFAGR